MKLILDARMYNYSGIGRYIKFLLSFLPDYFEVELLAYENDFKDKEFKIIPMKSKVYSPFEQIELKNKIKNTYIFWTPHFNVPVFNIRANYRITTIHDVCHLTEYSDLSPIKKKYARFLYTQAIKKSNLIFTVSEFTKKELIKRLNLSEKDATKIKVVYEALQKDFSSGKAEINLSRFPDEFILYVGNVKRHKNIEGLLSAFSLIQKKFNFLHLVIVGKKEKFISGNLDIETLTKEKKISPRVVFTGMLSDNELISLYKNARLLVLPSFYEGFGLPPLEAMANFCPVLLSNIEVFREVYEDSAIYCNPFNPYDIAEKISFCLENPTYMKELRNKALKKVEKYSIENIKENYLKYLKPLLEIAL